MFSIKKKLVILFAIAVLLPACDDDNSSNEFELGNKDGIMLVTFGSSYEAPQKTFENIDVTAKEKFTGEEIRWGYTSDIILNKLRQGNGEGSLNGQIIDRDTPQEGLRIMIEEDGYRKISIQSLHVIPGEEYDELMEAVEETMHKYPGVEIAVGKPLLSSTQDLKDVAAILADKFSDQRVSGEPVLFMGHGTPHENDKVYLELEAELQKLAPHFFIGTVEGVGFEAGITSIDAIITKLKTLDLNSQKVTITPLMSIAGDHANNDMNGIIDDTAPAEEQSWRVKLEKEGYMVTDVMKGLGDYTEINNIWLSHLEDAKLD
ncbi:sirohydrochlorin cobaltochelatase [Saccharicrinis fermentans]|uniref:Sirohydrochlorin cobaltochelatase CbiKP n=1 Tax=Saccharicrinis fermentans DSM 9555 = JCM 21142 TaxID=869213 RepID=W7Y3F7_9BACT|nr:sirohydrochlorin cobaltochelatase [Saccharicrinis fermentans]GAF02093.1 sirohydrochlorin cobaltochelatase CbiKP precursor [Saccharicrinis fermentans DSM 9555 = JCM 21142]